MKAIRRSRQLHFSHRKYSLTKSLTSNHDQCNSKYLTVQQKSIVRSNKNANRIQTSLLDTITNVSIAERQLYSSPDQSSLFLYSMNSTEKPGTISDDLTSLTITITNTTPLTALTYSSTKQTDIATVKIDLAQLSSIDTFNNSLTNINYDQSLALDRKISSSNINYRIKTIDNLIQTYDTDTSMKSVTFSKENSSEHDLLSHKHLSCFTISGVDNHDHTTIVSSSMIKDIFLPKTNVNLYQQTPIQWNSFRWNRQNMSYLLKIFISCTSLSLIVGIVVLVIIF